MNLSLVRVEYCISLIEKYSNLETPSTTSAPSVSSKKSESIKTEDISPKQSDQTKEDEVTINDDDDDDEAMFDDEEFESVSVEERGREIIYSIDCSRIHSHQHHPHHQI